MGVVKKSPMRRHVAGRPAGPGAVGRGRTVDLYEVIRQTRAARVGMFSRRNRKAGSVPYDRPWATVVEGEDYSYRPRNFVPPGPVGLVRTEIGRNELSFFLELVDEDLLRYVVRCTNKYATERRSYFRKERRSPWYRTTTTELKAFLGCMICAGYTHQPSLESYWSTEEDFGCELLKQTFPVLRFKQILRYLHYSSEGFLPPRSQRLKYFKERERQDQVRKVRTVMSRVIRNSCLARNVGGLLAVDEAMVSFRGRHHLRRYNPAKPTRYGYCIRVLAEPDGYILRDEVCGARRDPEDMPAEERAWHRIEQDEVCDLDSKPARIVHRLTVPFQGSFRTVYCDSFYTGLQLADHLFAHDTYLCGTVRKNALGLPNVKHSYPQPVRVGRNRKLDFRAPYPASVPKGTSTKFHDGPVTVVKWKDSKTLILLSTATRVDAPDKPVTRRCKSVGDRVHQNLRCPAAVARYQSYYKAVDLADQLRGSYEFGRPSKKWHRQLFWFVLNKAVVNAFLNWKLYIANVKPAPSANKTAQLSFRRELVKQLVANFTARQREATVPAIARPPGSDVTEEHRQVSRGKPSKACHYCRTARRLMSGAKRPRPHETVFACSSCHLYICSTLVRPQCWREHLEAVNK